MRYCTEFKLAGTLSFRLSSAKFLGFYGGNVQNPPAELMRCLRARPGKVFVQADQAGAEALIVAHIARRGRLRELFERRIKPHTFLAANIFAEKLQAAELVKLDIPTLAASAAWADLAKRLQDSSGPFTKEYALGKQTCHAANYGMGPMTFQSNVLVRSGGKLVLTVAEAKFFLEKYHSLFPEIREWHDEVKAALYSTRTLYNLFGYPCTFHGRRVNSLILQAYSWVPQSTVGVITHLAARTFYEKHRRLGTILNNKHDSYLVECDESAAAEVAARMQEAITAIPLKGPDGTEFRMKSEVQIGRNWGKFDERENPEGMKAL